jgi:hypothetical protein
MTNAWVMKFPRFFGGRHACACSRIAISDDSYKMMSRAASSSRGGRNLIAIKDRTMDRTTSDCPNLLPEIRALEEALHRSETRRSKPAVEALLAESFVEFGSSGRVYQRHEIITLLAREETDDEAGTLLSSDYALHVLSADAVLLTYRTRRTLADGFERTVLRSSIWQRSKCGWQMLFHQGTPSPEQPAASESAGARLIMP